MNYKIILALAGLGLLVLAGCQTQAQGAASNGGSAPTSVAPRVGYLAPDFTLSTLEGDSVTLSQLKGSIVVINFWATWCPSCREEMPRLEAVYKEFKGRGLVVLGVDIKEDKGTVARFIQEVGLTFPIPMDSDGAISDRYQVHGLPTSFFVDREGSIRFLSVGAMSETTIRSRVEKMMGVAP